MKLEPQTVHTDRLIITHKERARLITSLAMALADRRIAGLPEDESLRDLYGTLGGQ
jgi:hypothetical protein